MKSTSLLTFPKRFQCSQISTTKNNPNRYLQFIGTHREKIAKYRTEIDSRSYFAYIISTNSKVWRTINRDQLTNRDNYYNPQTNFSYSIYCVLKMRFFWLTWSLRLTLISSPTSTSTSTSSSTSTSTFSLIQVRLRKPFLYSNPLNHY